MSAWTDAIDTVAQHLSPLASADTTVTGYEPGNPGWRRPSAITCTFGPLTPTDFGVMVRVYVSTNQAINEAQTVLADLVLAADDALAYIAPGTVWQTVWLADENAWVCSTVVNLPREDF